MKKRHLSVVVAACLSLLALHAYAYKEVGTKAHSLTFTLGGGEDFFASKRRMHNAVVPFVAADYNFTKNWGVEGLVGFFNTSFKGDLDSGHQTNGNLALFDVMYHFTPYQCLQPYALAGVGVSSFSSNRYDGNNQGNINAGVGVEYHVNEVVSFKADVRDLYTIVGGKNDIFLSAGVNFAIQLCGLC